MHPHHVALSLPLLLVKLSDTLLLGVCSWDQVFHFFRDMLNLMLWFLPLHVKFFLKGDQAVLRVQSWIIRVVRSAAVVERLIYFLGRRIHRWSLVRRLSYLPWRHGCRIGLNPRGTWRPNFRPLKRISNGGIPNRGIWLHSSRALGHGRGPSLLPWLLLVGVLGIIFTHLPRSSPFLFQVCLVKWLRII